MRNRIFAFSLLMSTVGLTRVEAAAVKKDRLTELYQSTSTALTHKRLIGAYMQKREGREKINEKRRAVSRQRKDIAR